MCKLSNYAQVRARHSCRRPSKSKGGEECWTLSTRFKRGMMLWRRWRRTSRSCTRCSWTWPYWSRRKASNWTTSRPTWTELIRTLGAEPSSCRLLGPTRKTPANGLALVLHFCWSSSWSWYSSRSSHGNNNDDKNTLVQDIALSWAATRSGSSPASCYRVWESRVLCFWYQLLI